MKSFDYMRELMTQCLRNNSKWVGVIFRTKQTPKPPEGQLFFENDDMIMRRVPSTKANLEAKWPFVTMEFKKAKKETIKKRDDRPFWITNNKRNQKRGF